METALVYKKIARSLDLALCCPTCWCWPTLARVYLTDNRYFDLKDGDEIGPTDNIVRIVCLNCQQELY